ncbi:MAG: DUF3187 family protein [Pseudomonadota bacterium]
MPILIAMFLGWPLAASAAEPIIQARSYNPFTLIFGRPEFFSGSMGRAGSSEFRSTLQAVSYTEIEAAEGQSFELDGESYHLDFSYARVLRPGLELSLRLPILHHTGGWMDGPLTDWHDFLGVPNGKRDRQPDDALRFFFADDRGERVLVEEAGTGLGDLQFALRYRLTPETSARQLAVQGGLKAPTGSARRLTGSGAMDASLGLGYSDAKTLKWMNTTLAANLGVLLLGDGEVLPAYQKSSVVFGGLQASVQLTRKLSAIIGVQGAGPYYNTDIAALGEETIQLIFGGQYLNDAGWAFRFGIVEDGFSRVMPDFALHFALSKRFGAN